MNQISADRHVHQAFIESKKWDEKVWNVKVDMIIVQDQRSM